MKEVFDLVPKNKTDISGIEELSRIKAEKAEPILGLLLEWIKDLNWPAARELIKVLPRFHRQLVPHIKTVLHSDDDIWKSWVLLMLQDFPPETVSLLSDDIRRIAYSPAETEVLEETHEYAQEILTQFQLNSE